MKNTEIRKNIFPVGFYDDIHPDFSVNFQMNRCYTMTNDDVMLKEMREISPSIHNYEEFIEKFLELYNKALNEGHKLRAAYYLRTAEFYMTADHPQKQNYRKQFISLMQEYFNISDEQPYKVPYENGFLPAYRFTSEAPKGTIVMFGGFDSYVEEMFKMALFLKEAGYDVVFFDGPGQGSALEDYKIPMTHEWEKPVKSILDYFELDDVTLLGISLGGYLTVRAAAFEKRVHRVIADDILSNFYEVVLNTLPSQLKEKVNSLMSDGNEQEVNILFKDLMKKSLMVEWAINQGMHITGSKTPYEFLNKILLYNTSKISEKLEQDVLLMAAQEDHYIPLNQFFDQSKSLINVRSLTTRMFTRKETAQNHCQSGNLGLAFEVIANWIEQIQK
ncbi:alpha-beta hydrolase superfamily lysophospholipase [Clostridium acetobutylicum]|uniref:Hydrolase of the alpha/beta superfamily n=1 Tax=Clostridium acetobutylicum (strain ATCC 824 / DSM 792 / JCM 1419 / IAM 19013 / LMG 5710 / NBRC 13948 / NRRL B-527 / VKM B-1787 / 2291 / W) TaxID=272562 RepID=Q97MJ4_CLOAB|nr:MULTISPECIES: alpha/beta fold hydrolase [Clostridium]AAK78184.1 Hydrolase of the alpha/beta superfamily [Clostridium acetobutylicum ATCC 824]ADZ19248.1 Hydrolase of the alpha/beta superfamily [Clostridium acetobutylicum EA 2018]AEI31110.1 alpha/beta fold family hydrolase [Clostridium acetobutylicum DSM 1731]AWV81991.1 alpha/beta hydrolase [Clostridium acetobutylicum]MBC2395940.1 alpha/beta hydrolase [Clostridium acetobutylicum]